MGMNSHVYLGPAYRFKAGLFSASKPRMILACPNSLCAKRGGSVPEGTAFCSTCGSKIENKKILEKISIHQVFFDHFDELNLTDEFHHINGEEDKPDYLYFISNQGSIPGKSIGANDEDEGRITAESISDDLVAFKMGTKPLAEWLEALVGKENVECGFYYKTYYS